MQQPGWHSWNQFLGRTFFAEHGAEDTFCRWVRAVADFGGLLEGELSFRTGDTIELEKVFLEKGWALGRCVRSQSRGVFPMYLCVEIPQDMVFDNEWPKQFGQQMRSRARDDADVWWLSSSVVNPFEAQEGDDDDDDVTSSEEESDGKRKCGCNGRCVAHSECIICLDKAPEFACVPCGHLALCGDHGRIRVCPLCRHPVEQLLRVYF